MAVRQAECRCLVQHWDKSIGGTRIRGSTFVLPLDSANRRKRAGLVDIVREFTEDEGPTEIKPFEAKAEITMGAEATVEKGPLTVESGGAALVPEIEADVEIEGLEDLEITLEMDMENEIGDEEVSPEDLLTRRGESSWFDVEGYDQNPVQGRGKALQIAKDLLDT